MSFKAEVYPNSPLVEVVFEIRFPGELQVECERHKFWQRVRNDYPTIRVPHPDSKKAMALMPYRFDHQEQDITIIVAMNTLGLSATGVYPGYQAFRREFLRIQKIFGEVFSVPKLSRVGWRYVNVIPFVREAGLIPLSRFLTLGFRLPPAIPERFNTLDLTFSAKTDGGTITTRLQSLIRGDQKENAEALLLDFDYGKDGKEQELLFDKVGDYMDEAHSFTRRLFEDLITDKYRSYLRGETV